MTVNRTNSWATAPSKCAVQPGTPAPLETEDRGKIRSRLRTPLRRCIPILALAVLACDGLPDALGMAGERFVVVGGGVCGVTCCQTLASAIQDACDAAGSSSAGAGRVTLVAAAGLLKGVANVVRLSRHVDSFDVVEQPFDAVAGPHTEVIEGEAVAVDTESKELALRDGRKVPFDKLCICTGARPKLIGQNERVLALRYASYACLICMPYMHAFYACLICVPCVHCLTCMPHMHPRLTICTSYPRNAQVGVHPIMHSTAPNMHGCAPIPAAHSQCASVSRDMHSKRATRMGAPH